MLLLLLALAAGPGDWTDYRGPGRDGHADGAELPTAWSEEHNVAWKTPIHGRGWSSPVLLEGRAWLTTAPPTGDTLSVLAVDLETGRVEVDRVVFTIDEPEHRNGLNSYASPSPVVEGGRVFVHFGTYGTACLDATSGETFWQRTDLNCDHLEGPGSSPLLEGGRLFLHLDGADVQYLVALDPATGETLWRTERSADLEPLGPDLRKAYSTPLLARMAGEDGPREVLVSSAARATYGYDPATGEELWRMDHPGFSMSSRPLLVDDRVIVSTGFNRAELWAFRLGGAGNITDEAFLWRNTRGVPTMPSSVIVGARLFQVSDRGMASAVDLGTGETLWQERLGEDHCASLLASGDLIYAFGVEGKATVFRAGGAFEKLHESQLEAGFMASPAVHGDALILRTKTHLYRIEAKQ